MIIAGKLTGVIIGLPFGIFGILFGVLAGTLVDQVLGIQQNRKDIEQFLVMGKFIPRIKRFIRPAAAIALCVKIYSIDQVFELESRDKILKKIADFFRIRAVDEHRLMEFWTAAMKFEPDLDVDWLKRVYAASNPDFLELSGMYSYAGESERDFLFSLMHYIAGMDEKGLSREEFDYIQDVFEPMGLGRREIRERMRSVPYLNTEFCNLMELERENCTEADLKKRYRELAAFLHPDSSLNIGYSEDTDGLVDEKEKREQFSRLQTAYSELLWQFRLHDND